MGFGHEASSKRLPKQQGQATGRSNPFGGSAARAPGASLSDVPDGLRAMDAALNQGCAVMVARTRDGGAYSVTVLDGDDRYRAYAATQDELNSILDKILETYLRI